MLYITLFFESICFPTIVALGMRGLGKHSKRGSGWIIAGVSGGAAVPPALGAVSDARNTGVAMVIPLIFFVLAWTYSLAVNFVPAYREPIDMMKDSTLAVPAAKDDEESGVEGKVEMEKDGTERREVGESPEIGKVG